MYVVIMDVTILILIDGFLQLKGVIKMGNQVRRHNPYFNRWFSAIQKSGLEEYIQMVSQSLF